jgi:hypothetical protein
MKGRVFLRRVAHVRLEDGALLGREADPGVLIPAFDPGVEWFTTIWGDYADDMLALQLDESVTGPLPRIPHQGTPPLARFVDGLREYQLDRSIQERLEFMLGEQHDYRIGVAPVVRREIKFHDEFFWIVRPVDGATLRAVARQLLALHEEYLDCGGALTTYVEPLCELVRRGGEVKLKSNPRGELRVMFGKRRFLARRSHVWWPIPRLAEAEL